MVAKYSAVELQRQLDAEHTDNYTVRLFVNAPVIGTASVLGDFAEPIFPGYAGAPLGAWNPATFATPYALKDAGVAAFVSAIGFVGPVTINGYFITNTGTGLYIGAAYLTSGPFVFTFVGQQLQITPVFRASNAP